MKPKDKTVAEIEKLKHQRENRRKSAEEFKRKRALEIKENERKGRPGDVDFQRMIYKFRTEELPEPTPHTAAGDLKINVVVRKRPVSALEVNKKDYDTVSCNNPHVFVHHCKYKVDGITKYLDNVSFEIDHAFDENCSNETVYKHTAKHLVQQTVNGGRATCFAYGQTGSGKTFTMAGVQTLAAQDIFRLIRTPEYMDKSLQVYCSFFELYGGRCIDLLHGRQFCAVREDGKGRVQMEGLQEVPCYAHQDLLDCIDRGNSARTTHATEMNNDSSRSHAICQIALRRGSRRSGEPYGKLSLIDLAGSERGQDTKHHNKQRRAESAEINKSLLALKECIRALSCSKVHVPYRASKLTMVLKDSFSLESHTVMISCVSPAASSSDHTLNTLRYADRVKEKRAALPPTVTCSSEKRRQTLDPQTVGESLIGSFSPDDEMETEQKRSEKAHSSVNPPAPPTDVVMSGHKSASQERKPVVETPEFEKPTTSIPTRSSQSGSTFGQNHNKSNRVREPEVVAKKPKAEEESMSFDEVVRALVDEEEELLRSHMQCIQKNADLLTQEGELLAKVQGQDVVDYDIEEYASQLDEILTNKIDTFQKLHFRLKKFRKHLALEEVSANVVQTPNNY